MKKRKKTLKIKDNTPWIPEVCNFKHELVDNQYESLGKNIDELKDKIKVVEESINNKLDKIDISLRGNGKIGVFEQQRQFLTQQKQLQEKLDGYEKLLKKIKDKSKKILKWLLRVLFIMLILSAGGKIYHLGWNDIKEKVFGPKSPDIQITCVDPNYRE